MPHAEVGTPATPPATAHRAELYANGFLRGHEQTSLSEWSLRWLTSSTLLRFMNLRGNDLPRATRPGAEPKSPG